jgi:hypothetical protein
MNTFSPDKREIPISPFISTFIPNASDAAASMRGLNESMLTKNGSTSMAVIQNNTADIKINNNFLFFKGASIYLFTCSLLFGKKLFIIK